MPTGPHNSADAQAESLAASSFLVGRDNFDDLMINPTAEGQFYYFSNRRTQRIIKQFVLAEQERVNYTCQVVLIKKGEKFTPRLEFSVRDKTTRKIVQDEPGSPSHHQVKANVSLERCYEQMWSLVGFLQSLREIEIPTRRFRLMTQSDAQIIEALKGRDSASVLNIVRGVAQGLAFSKDDINSLLQRRERLAQFKTAIAHNTDAEIWWQEYFEANKWIFGYGLNYQILKTRQSQATYGGTRFDGKGAQRGDYLTATTGDIKFTVLVEIKTPTKPLLQGDKPQRNGAWSLSKELVDAVTQIQANIDTWNKQGSNLTDNRDVLERESIFTVQPKGIVVIGRLEAVRADRSQWETFQRFRSCLHGIELLTFDELLSRAEYIVNSDQ